MRSRNKIAILNILSTILLSGISIFTSPLFSRLLGEAGYGIYSVYTTWVGIIAIVFTLQTQQTLVHARTSFPENEQNKYQSAVLFLSCIVYSIFCVIIVLFLDKIALLLKLDKLIVVLMLVHAFGIYCVGFINNKFTYEFKANRNFWISIGVTTSTILLSIILIRVFPTECNYYGRVLGLSVIYGCIGIAIFAYIVIKGRCIFSSQYWKFCIPLAIPLVFQCLADLLLGHSDSLMLQHMLDNRIVGQYTLAYSFAGILLTLFRALNNSWCPFFYDGMRKNQIEQVAKFSKNYLELFTVITIGFMLLTKEVYHLYASKDFWAGTDLIFWFAISNFFIFLSTFSINVELYHQKAKYLAIGTTLSMLVNIVLNYLLINLLGMIGAAIATTTSHCIQFAFHHCIAVRLQGNVENPFRLKLFGPYLAAVVATFLVVNLTANLWWIRWLFGISIGLFELYRIFRRKTIF